MSIPSETSIFPTATFFISHTRIHLKKIVDNIYHFFQEQMQQQLSCQQY